MTHEDPREVLVTPAVDISIVFSPDGGRAFQMRFAPLPLNVTTKELNETLDRVLAAVERQRAKFELNDEMMKLSDQTDRIKKYEAAAISIEQSSREWWAQEGRRGDWSPDKGYSPTAKNERERLQVALANDRHDATARQAKIRRLQDKVNGHAAEFSTDSDAGLSDR